MSALIAVRTIPVGKGSAMLVCNGTPFQKFEFLKAALKKHVMLAMLAIPALKFKRLLTSVLKKLYAFRVSFQNLIECLVVVLCQALRF